MFRAAPLAPQSKETRRISSGRAEVASPPDLRKLPEAALPRLERQGPASFAASNQPSNEGDPVIPGGEGVLSGQPDSEPSVGPRAGAWPLASQPPRIKLTVPRGVAWFVHAGKRPFSVCGQWGASALLPCAAKLPRHRRSDECADSENAGGIDLCHASGVRQASNSVRRSQRGGSQVFGPRLIAESAWLSSAADCAPGLSQVAMCPSYRGAA